MTKKLTQLFGEGTNRNYDRGASIIDYIEKQAIKYPSQVVLVDGNNSLTYSELLRKAYHVANQLEQLGLCYHDSIALLITPSNEFIVIVIASLILGACYIPIEKDYPKERVDYILKNSDPKLIITDTFSFGKDYNLDAMLISVSKLDFRDISLSKNKRNLVQGHDPAYIIYTSGSTGYPKGIIIPHRAVNNHMLWMIDAFQLSQQDRFLLKTPIAFDPSVWEIFVPLYLGATLFIAEPKTYSSPSILKKYINQHNITILQLVPVILHKLLLEKKDSMLKSLRYLFVGGESLTKKTKVLFYKLFTHCQLINLYGPSETTIDVTYYAVTNCKDDIKHNYIGKPIYNTTLYVMNKQEQLCDIGEVGELYIGGDNVALGYVNNKKFDELSFTKLPFQKEAIIYKTGDFVKWTKDGLLEYVGRTDNQIKLNGVRIELDNLKKNILNVDGVYDCEFEIEYNNKYQYTLLICYLLPIDSSYIDIEKVKFSLSSKLPKYMIPHQFFVLNKLHLTPNGKIDIKKAKAIRYRNNTKPSNKISNASNKTQEKLFSIWGSILRTAVEDKNIDFYDLGGDSISSYVLSNEIKNTFSVDLDPSHIVHYSTISKQSDYIESKKITINIKKENCFSPIFSLNSKCDKTIFLIHPIGGTIFWYHHLSRLLDKKIQILAIQDPALSEKKSLFNNINEMALHYTKLIQKFQPSGTYYLGGASFGSTVAIEIAKNLLNLGCEVNTVLVFDGWAIYPNELKDKNYFYASMLRQQQEWKSKFQESNLNIQFESLFNIQMERLKMLYEYQLEPFDFHIDIFKAKCIMPIFESINHPYNHWDKYTKNFNIYSVPGNHETMFLRKNVVEMAKIIAPTQNNPPPPLLVKEHEQHTYL